MKYIIVKLRKPPQNITVHIDRRRYDLYICEVSDEEALLYSLKGILVVNEPTHKTQTPARRFRNYYGDAIFRTNTHEDRLLGHHCD